MRRILTLVLIWALILPTQVGATVASAASKPVSIKINGQPARFTDALIRDGNIMVRAEDIHTCGLADCSTTKAGPLIFSSQGVTITLTPGSRQATVNKLPFTMKQPTIKQSSHVMVPLEFVCKAFGYSYSQRGAAVSISLPQPAPKPQGGLNSITGRVTFAGTPLRGISLRLVNRDEGSGFVEGCEAKSDSHGAFKFASLPNGAYCVYAYIGDNPGYFNRMSEKTTLAGGSYSKVADIHMGRILSISNPKSGATVAPVSGKISLSCSPCLTASGYRFTVIDSASKVAVAETTSAKPSVRIPMSDLVEGREYVWQVESLDAYGEFLGGSPGCGTEPWTFTVRKK